MAQMGTFRVWDPGGMVILSVQTGPGADPPNSLKTAYPGSAP